MATTGRDIFQILKTNPMCADGRLLTTAQLKAVNLIEGASIKRVQVIDLQRPSSERSGLQSIEHNYFSYVFYIQDKTGKDIGEIGISKCDLVTLPE